MKYRLLQFTTVLLGYTFLVSIANYSLVVLPQKWSFTLIGIISIATAIAYLLWLVKNDYALHSKLIILPILLGLVLGVWL